jgi:ankyrin repeat protein
VHRYFKQLQKTLWLLLLSVAAYAGSYDDFFVAIGRDNATMVQDLLSRGFDPNTINPQGVPGLLIAIRTPAPKVVSTLLGHPDINVELRNPKDESALMLAALDGNLELCTTLLKMDADVNKPGWAPLHYAATTSRLDVMRLLLENYAYIDAASPNGTTPLMMAAMYGNSSAVKLLLEAGADPNLKNQLGLSAIDFAQQVKRIESAEIIAAFVRARRPKGTW